MNTVHKLLHRCVLLLALLLTACAANVPNASVSAAHTFEFDARVDSKDIQILNP